MPTTTSLVIRDVQVTTDIEGNVSCSSKHNHLISLLKSNNEWTNESKEYLCQWFIPFRQLAFKSTCTAIPEPFVYTAYQQNRTVCLHSISAEQKRVIIVAAVKMTACTPKREEQVC
jgi:hypothetical protein